jgi:hypothetical protein
MTTVFIPVITTTPGNTRKHWRVEAKEAKAQRTAARHMVAVIKDKPPFPVRVTFTRCSPRSLDRQNMGGAMKHLIDGVADAYGVDDRDERWQFVFIQRKQSLCGVEITIEAVE